jgi:hypothetical protein
MTCEQGARQRERDAGTEGRRLAVVSPQRGIHSPSPGQRPGYAATRIPIRLHGRPSAQRANRSPMAAGQQLELRSGNSLNSCHVRRIRRRSSLRPSRTPGGSLAADPSKSGRYPRYLGAVRSRPEKSVTKPARSSILREAGCPLVHLPMYYLKRTSAVKGPKPGQRSRGGRHMK